MSQWQRPVFLFFALQGQSKGTVPTLCYGYAVTERKSGNGDRDGVLGGWGRTQWSPHPVAVFKGAGTEEHRWEALINTPGCLKRRELCLNRGTVFFTKCSCPYSIHLSDPQNLAHVTQENIFHQNWKETIHSLASLVPHLQRVLKW